jgi:hypothetical protein
LLELIKARLETISDLVIVYMDLVAEFPTQINKYTRALDVLRNEKGLTVAGGDRLGNPAQQEIDHALLDVLFGPDLAVEVYVLFLIGTVWFMMACVTRIKPSRSKHARFVFLDHAFSSCFAGHICMAERVTRLIKLIFSQRLRRSRGLVL